MNLSVTVEEDASDKIQSNRSSLEKKKDVGGFGDGVTSLKENNAFKND